MTPATKLQRRTFLSLVAGTPFLQGQTPDLTKPERILPLRATTAHVQGIDTDGQRLWVTAVDRPTTKGFLYQFSIKDGSLEQTVEVQNGPRYHPGGLQFHNNSLWLPVAEYRRTSTAVIQKRNAKTLALEFQFPVDDHIGCVAVTPDTLIGGNWDSRDFYVWDHQGKLLKKVPNPTGNSFQDLKFSQGQLVGSGALQGNKPAIDWLTLPEFKQTRRLTAGNTDTGAPLTREGMTLHNNEIWFLPEDTTSRLMIFPLPPR